MALCNEMTSQYQADRVSVGLLKGRYIKLKAMSHTEKFSRKMQLIQNIEAAMEEAVDQDAEVTFPEPEQAKVVCRASKSLSAQHGPSVVLVLPLRLGGEVVGALCLERSAEVALQPGEAETIRLACDLATPRLLELYHRDRWFGSKGI
jgi:transcriptional regulator with GAF, ATPase, and Fis domain